MSTIVQEYRPCQLPVVRDPYTGLDGLVDGAIGRFQRRSAMVSRLRKEAELIDSKDEDWKFLSDEALRRHLLEFKEQARRSDKLLQACLPDAIAAIREAAGRITGLRPFLVQIMGTLALHRGYLAEMATGEGKTLTAAMAAILAGWSGRPCHVITVNDYLAKRDSEWFEPLYSFCGVSVGYVVSVLKPQDRAKAYACAVTYTTSKEVVADFLRDRLRLGEQQHPTRRLLRHHLMPYRKDEGLVMRGLHSAIVDEADSVLIDEAVTPLVISSSLDNHALQQVYKQVWSIARTLQKDVHYKVDLRYREISLLPPGRTHVEANVHQLPERWRGSLRPQELVEQALNAREFFKRGKQYVVQQNKVVIVDEFTGRMMPMRKWRHGLHQAIEAKENLPISSMDQTLTRLSFQRYFRLYRHIAGMTGTAREAASELWHIYQLPVIRIPSNKPVIRRELPDRMYAVLEEKLDAIVADVEACHLAGRPVLVGTRNVSTSQVIAKRLHAEGFKVNLLNALNDRQEAQIIAKAGEPGTITIATNMAGRGTDIKLGEGVAALGGVHVIATERHESRRIDRQLFGRSGRQGDPGSAVAYVSSEDELLQRFAPNWLLRLFSWALRSHFPGARVVGLFTSRLVQSKAQRVASISRKSVMKMDSWLDEAVGFSGKSLT